jgi:GntR family transcriptional regulator, transcriptional repressor for pyruvate dehydrogenase complex
VLWGLRPIEPRAAFGLAVDLLQRQIHSGLLLPGERLPAERQLSEKFGISRVTLREALRVLETDQYITVRRGAQGGAFVTNEVRLSQLAHRRISRAPAAAMRVAEFLAVNQLAAARFAVARRGRAELIRMRQSLGMMHNARTAPVRRQSETLFLLAMAEAAHNPLLLRAVEDGLAELFLPFESAPDLRLDEARLSSFKDLFGAVDEEDLRSAEEAMASLNELLWDALRRTAKQAA